MAGDDIDGMRMRNESTHPRSDPFDELLVRYGVSPHTRSSCGGDSAGAIPKIAPDLAQSIAGRVEAGDPTIAHQGSAPWPLVGIEQIHESGPDPCPGEQGDALVHSPIHVPLHNGL
jgi:hypothetical protein